MCSGHGFVTETQVVSLKPAGMKRQVPPCMPHAPFHTRGTSDTVWVSFARLFWTCFKTGAVQGGLWCVDSVVDRTRALAVTCLFACAQEIGPRMWTLGARAVAELQSNLIEDWDCPKCVLCNKLVVMVRLRLVYRCCPLSQHPFSFHR